MIGFERNLQKWWWMFVNEEVFNKEVFKGIKTCEGMKWKVKKTESQKVRKEIETGDTAGRCFKG